MKVLIVLAHPDPASFNAAMKDTVVETFSREGCEVRVTDLYAGGFRPVDTAADFAAVTGPGEAVVPDVLQQRQVDRGEVPADIAAHLADIRWCDLLVLQFPVWWFSAPAMLKGWFERVLLKGEAYGGGRKHGTGVFRGRHGLVSCTTGTPAATYAPDGVEGDIERLLWPVDNGIFHYLGMTPYRPFVSFAPRAMSAEERGDELERYAAYLSGLGSDDELPVHGADDYGDDHRLRAGVEPRSGFQYRP
jgi:NAD(P)H dehydrogenase (quinone)